MVDRTRTFVIGNENCILGFGLMGVDGRVVHDQEELMATVAACLEDQSIAILLVSSDAAALAPEYVDELKVSSMAPLVVAIPGQGEGGGYPSLREFVQRAVGVNLGGS